MQYPLVTETGETFLSHRTLLRHIREKCGDAVGEYLAQFLGEDAESLKNAALLKKVKEHLDSLALDMHDMDVELGSAVSLMEKAGGRMNEKKSMAFRFLCLKDSVRSFFRFICFIPGFWKLNRFWDVEPSFYGWVIRQYSTVMNELTGGKLSKPSHSAETVIDEIWNYMEKHYAGWQKEENG